MYSIAMAVYNGENYIIEQLESIMAQTIKADEVIICDDVSCDKTVELINNFINTNNLSDTWRLFTNECNLGYADNFYKAMSLTKGDYVFLSDQDDIWLPDRVERMLGVMEKNKQIMLLGSEFQPYYCTEDAPQISKSTLKRMINDNSVEHVRLNNKTIFIGCEGCTMCVRKEFLMDINKYWYSGWAHDEYLWKLALCYDGCYIYHSNTLKRRLHSNNVSKRKMHELSRRVKFLSDLLESHKRTLECGHDKKISRKHIKLINKNINSVKLRIQLLEEKKLINSIHLALFYSCNYHSKKSIPVELLMAVRG